MVGCFRRWRRAQFDADVEEVDGNSNVVIIRIILKIENDLSLGNEI